MNKDYPVRVNSIDKCFVENRVRRYVRSSQELVKRIQAEPAKLPQIRHATLAGDYACIGYDRYALGYPIQEVMHIFRQAAQAYLVVFKLRGTESAFHTSVLTLDNKNGFDVVVNSRPLHDADSRDFSLTNSKRGLEAMAFALIAGDRQLAKEIAGMIWDPPNASYIGLNSDVCTPNELHFAFAIKHILAKRFDDLAVEITHFTANKKDAWLSGVKDMLEGIVSKNERLFLIGLDDEVNRFGKVARKARNAWNPECYMNLYYTVLSILAIDEQITNADNLPKDNEYLAVEMIGPKIV